MNVTNIIGNLGRDPELITTASGKPLTRMSVAIDRVYYRTSADGSRTKESNVDWIPVVLWGDLAKNCATYLMKGSKVGITGELRSRSWTREDGKTQYALELHGQTVTFLNKIKSNADEDTEVVADPSAM